MSISNNNSFINSYLNKSKILSKYIIKISNFHKKHIYRINKIKLFNIDKKINYFYKKI